MAGNAQRSCRLKASKSLPVVTHRPRCLPFTTAEMGLTPCEPLLRCPFARTARHCRRQCQARNSHQSPHQPRHAMRTAVAGGSAPSFAPCNGTPPPGPSTLCGRQHRNGRTSSFAVSRLGIPAPAVFVGCPTCWIMPSPSPQLPLPTSAHTQRQL